MIVKDFIAELATELESADVFFGHGTNNAQDEAFYLVFATLDLDWHRYDSEMEKQLTEEEFELLKEQVLLRVEERLPTAYLVGVAWFAGYPFRSDSRALVPRSPIGELLINRLEPLIKDEPRRLLDLCCGGGCIGIASAQIFSDARVDLADISPEALQLAQENIQLHAAGKRVKTIESDLFQQLSDRRYDVILSNPPYVGQDEFASLPQEFQHEPELGLVSEDQGLRIPLKILQEAAGYLNAQGILILEVGYSYKALIERCPDVPFLWLEFEHGGEGVLMLTKSQLLEYRECFI